MKDDPSSEYAAGLAKVHPAFMEIARTRISAIEQYLAGERSAEALRRTAKAIDLSVSRTGRLIRSYELHRDVALIAGEGHKGKRQPANERRAFARQAVQAAICELGTAAQAAEIEKAVVTACEAASVKPPSTQLIWKALAKARRANRLPASGTDPVTVVGRVWLQLPVMFGKGEHALRPEALVAMDLPSKRIRACVTDLRLHRKPHIMDLKGQLEADQPVRIGSIEIGNITDQQVGFPITADDTAQTTLIRHLGNGIGELELLFRRPRSDANVLRGRGGGQLLSPKEAEDVLQLALMRHEEEIKRAIEETRD